MKVKLNRGPMKNRRMEVNDYDNLIKIQVPLAKETYIKEIKGIYPDAIFPVRTGSYMKSNVQLRDGTWVFEWMGWYG